MLFRSFAYPHNGLGNVYRDLKRYDEAIAAYRHAIALDPAYANPHNGLGSVYADLKRYDEAIAAYRQAILLEPAYAAPHNGLGLIYSLQNRNEEAGVAFKRALELDPQWYSVMGCLARLERLAGNSDQANAWIAQARALLPADDFYNRACLESAAGNADAAIEALRVALEREEATVAWAREDPDFVFIRNAPRYRVLVGLDTEAPPAA